MRIALVLAGLLLVTNAHANQAGEGDEMDRFLADKGLLEKSGPAVEPPVVNRPSASKASELVVAAMGSLGVPYRRGGNTFEGGFDCSGFVRAMYEQTAGLVLPRVAAQQAAATQKIDRTELQPGDLVFFNTLHRAFSHVGIYVGDYKFIHSPKPGAEVRIEDLRVNYWNRRFDGARRVLAQSTPSQRAPTAAAQSSYTPY
jgi:cell wall-associated NlpC family hydrolase